MKAAVFELGPYLVLILVGFLPNEVWRVVGLVTARGLNEDPELVIWSRTVANWCRFWRGYCQQADLVLEWRTRELFRFPCVIGACDIRFRHRYIGRSGQFLLASPLEKRNIAARRVLFRTLRSNLRHGSGELLEALSAFRTSGFSFYLPAASTVTPALRGMTRRCKWKTTCPPAPSLNC